MRPTTSRPTTSSCLRVLNPYLTFCNSTLTVHFSSVHYAGFCRLTYYRRCRPNVAANCIPALFLRLIGADISLGILKGRDGDCWGICRDALAARQSNDSAHITSLLHICYPYRFQPIIDIDLSDTILPHTRAATVPVLIRVLKRFTKIDREEKEG
jgi:hypothetical protein